MTGKSPGRPPFVGQIRMGTANGGTRDTRTTCQTLKPAQAAPSPGIGRIGIASTRPGTWHESRSTAVRHRPQLLPRVDAGYNPDTLGRIHAQNLIAPPPIPTSHA